MLSIFTKFGKGVRRAAASTLSFALRGGMRRGVHVPQPVGALQRPRLAQNRADLGALADHLLQPLDGRVDGDRADQAEVEHVAHVKHEIAVQVLLQQLLAAGLQKHGAG